jgi:hypothetical protein
MSKQFILVIASLLLASIVVGLMFRRSLLAKAIAIVLLCYPLGIYALVMTYDFYTRGRSPTISRHNTSVALVSYPTYGNFSLILHTLAGIFLIVGGTYFAAKYLRQWRSNAS